nr:unnamed protein product [Digitaria exilis]
MSKAKNSNGYLGVTEPISLSGPTEKDLVQTAEVEKYLSDAGLYESQEEAVSREEVLGKLDQTVKAWIKKATRISGYGDQFVHEANAKIFTFGSYRLGVHGPGADIDTLCVGPRHATRNDYFFRWLHDMLAEMPEVSELHPVPDAHVPVLGFKINGISIDLLYANLAHAVIPEPYGSGSPLNSSNRECADSAANNLLSSSPAVVASDELDELTSFHQIKANQKDVNADQKPSLEGCSEDNLEQTCSLRPQYSNNLKRKANEELEIEVDDLGETKAS